MTEYLVFHGNFWHICHPGAIHDDTDECPECFGNNKTKCGQCNNGRVLAKNRTLRLAWFERDNSFVCFEYNGPDVKALPEPYS